MALARFALKNVHERVATARLAVSSHNTTRIDMPSYHVNLFSTSATSDDYNKETKYDKSDQGRETAVTDKGGRKKSKWFPISLGKGGRGGGLWRNNTSSDSDLQHLVPSGLGRALQQATENFSRLLENLNPSRLLGRWKEQDECYKLEYPVPGLTKEDIQITLVDGVLTIRGERREKEEESSDDEQWAVYGYYNTVLLPDDANEDGIQAEMKDGVLKIIIPRTERPKKDVKEIKIQ
ncbi:hypothetical protein IFM89_022980 [Coptis chinensis]|uniref:SHSP domain-containing protein n=1 Tax=Coptis chinensis TaxID=261450 RepID=A0A835IDW0_9MAGN|nr:hypothetical protein IFM89_022980 [Coptis chinensis]